MPTSSQLQSQPLGLPRSQPATPINHQRHSQRTEPRGQTQMTPISTSKKRARSRTPPMSDAQQRRMANIQAALADSSASATPPIPALNLNSAKRTRLASAQPVPEDEDEEYTRFFSPPPDLDHNPPTPTPQRRIKTERGGMATPPTSTSLASSASKSKPSQWAKIQGDPSNPFHAISSSLRTTEPASSLPNTPGGGGGGPAEMPEEIQALIDGANALPALITKLQRRNLASERSVEAKGRKIEELQEENDRYGFALPLTERTC